MSGTSPLLRRPIVVGALVVLVLLAMYALLPTAPTTSIRGGTSVRLTVIPSRMEFLIVSDLDKRSAIAESKKPRWRAMLKKGVLVHNPAADAGAQFTVEWQSIAELSSGHGEEGRGMELSELTLWNDRLYSMDDRSGIVFEIVDYGTPQARVVPRFILMEGDGNTDKGFKSEWSAVVNGNLIVASFGKEYAGPAGSIKNYNNNWVAEITPAGLITYRDWSVVYNSMRKHAGYEFPAYILHEAVLWSDLKKEWTFLPRRMCKTPYDENEDERMGANTLFTLGEDFSVKKTVTVGTIVPERGFSTAKFVPGSGDEIILALKSAEYAATDRQTSYITVFTADGKVLLPEQEIEGDMKYEGLEFIGL